MDRSEANSAIIRAWMMQWPTKSASVTGASVPYSTDFNVKAETQATPAEYFARLAIVSLDSEQRSLGPIPRVGQRGRRTWTHNLVIEVRLSGPLNEGREKLDDLSKCVSQIYQGRRLGRRTTSEKGVTTHECAVAELRRDSEASHRAVLLCTISAEFTEIA